MDDLASQIELLLSATFCSDVRSMSYCCLLLGSCFYVSLFCKLLHSVMPEFVSIALFRNAEYDVPPRRLLPVTNYFVVILEIMVLCWEFSAVNFYSNKSADMFSALRE